MRNHNIETSNILRKNVMIFSIASMAKDFVMSSCDYHVLVSNPY